MFTAPGAHRYSHKLKIGKHWNDSTAPTETHPEWKTKMETYTHSLYT